MIAPDQLQPSTSAVASRSATTARWHPTGRQLLAVFVFFVIMLAAGHDLSFSAHYDDIQQGSSDELADMVATGGSISRRIAFAALLAFGIFLLLRTRNESTSSSVLPDNMVLVCFVGFAFLSSLWSSDPELTFRRASQFLVVCIAAAAAGRFLGMRGIVWFGFLGATGFLLIGIISEVLLGTFHPMNSEYRFCGTLHPNHQAWNCGLLLISGSALSQQFRRHWRMAFYLAMTLGVLCLLLTKSRTSLVCGTLALLFYWAGRPFSRKNIVIIYAAGTVLTGILFIATLVPSAVESHLNRVLLAGRDADSYQNFSGRLPLWSLAMEYVGQRTFAGYGFNSFWSPEHILKVSAEENWSVSHSHNDYIELMLGLGVIGLLLYLSQLACTWWRLYGSYHSTRDPFLRFYLALLIFYLTCMFSEAIAFDVGLPTFCLLSLLWSRRQFVSLPARGLVLVSRATQAYQ